MEAIIIENNKLFISNKSIRAFKNCKRRFNDIYVDKINTITQKSHYLSFGTSLHSTLAEYSNLSSELQTYENCIKIMQKHWNSEGYKSKKDEENYFLKARKMLQNYCNDRKDLGRIILNEEMIKHHIGKNIVLCGKLDKVYINENNKLEVLDFKTGESFSPIIDLKNDLQLPVYLLLLRYRLGVFPDVVSYYYLSINDKVSIDVTKEIRDYCLSQLKDIISDIYYETQLKHTPISCSKTNCVYFGHCKYINSDVSCK